MMPLLHFVVFHLAKNTLKDFPKFSVTMYKAIFYSSDCTLSAWLRILMFMEINKINKYMITWFSELPKFYLASSHFSHSFKLSLKSCSTNLRQTDRNLSDNQLPFHARWTVSATDTIVYGVHQFMQYAFYSKMNLLCLLQGYLEGQKRLLNLL